MNEMSRKIDRAVERARAAAVDEYYGPDVTSGEVIEALSVVIAAIEDALPVLDEAGLSGAWEILEPTLDAACRAKSCAEIAMEEPGEPF